jgi:hypothetical protein
VIRIARLYPSHDINQFNRLQIIVEVGTSTGNGKSKWIPAFAGMT